MLLTDKVRVELPTDRELEPIDIFADAAASLFPDEFVNSHGEAGATIVYKRFQSGEIRLNVSDPAKNDERQLFAHYLWNASIYSADQIEHGTWTVKGQRVLELGAGVGLVGIMSALMAANEVVVSDFPAEAVLANLVKNVKANVPSSSPTTVTVAGHAWGQLDDGLALTHRQYFSVIFAADCFWMPWEHVNLAKSMLHFLSMDDHARIYAVAGFHTGRAKLAPFFDVATNQGLEIEHIHEVDVHGISREWVAERDGGKENVTERKKWLAIATFKRRVR